MPLPEARMTSLPPGYVINQVRSGMTAMLDTDAIFPDGLVHDSTPASYGYSSSCRSYDRILTRNCFNRQPGQNRPAKVFGWHEIVETRYNDDF